MPPQIKLYYFDLRGRMEVSRLILAQAGVNYEDVRIPRDQWPEWKKKMAFGQVPAMDVDGKRLFQSLTIARFLAREFGLSGRTSFDAAECEMIAETFTDMFDAGVLPVIKAQDDAAKKAAVDNTITEVLPKFLGMLENYLRSKGGKHFVNNEVTWADLACADLLSSFQLMKVDGGLIQKYPLLDDLTKRIMDLPNIKAWVSRRPSSSL